MQDRSNRTSEVLGSGWPLLRLTPAAYAAGRSGLAGGPETRELGGPGAGGSRQPADLDKAIRGNPVAADKLQNNHFTIEKVHGQGAYGTVYRV
jgi:hypothetical protein